MSTEARTRRGPLRALFLPVSLAILLLAALAVPLPFFLEAPGTPLSLTDNVAVETGTAVDGEYLLTAVNLRQGTVARAVQGWVDADAVLVRSSRFLPPGEDGRVYFDRQRDIFRASVDIAAAVALSAAGLDVDPTAVTGSGALVGRILLGAPADGILEPGDVIVAVDDTPVRITDDLRGSIDPEGDEAVTLTVQRDGEEREVELTPGVIDTAEGPIRGIGVEIQTADPRITLPVDVAVESGSIGGPSAGLMLALTIYDMVADGDLARGRTIAGTGTLSPEGVVGPIGGIARKITSAERAGADVFVSPMAQVEAARAAVRPGSGLEVVGVNTFEEALAALGVSAGEVARPAVAV